ncbi:hypothetical protein [Aeromicrobium sp. CnD17-E]|uniref:hypothetical protein n=1 Tax=Aeromicrobium sp. CnD17-E TaxID=2954487 RepID=UPI002097FED6|nr:hypothetical protein [Aeromicrobium sp. CnD17-E]MCO7238387.1 hypothetical protein [Aeromicrobium sp. CnD17-E]
MVKNLSRPTPQRHGALRLAAALVRVYVGIVVLTLAALVVLSLTAPGQATAHAWGHAVVVAVFAVVLPLRLRRARAGDRVAVRAVGIVAAVLFLVNVVEAMLPAFPLWMRVDMLITAVVVLGVALDVVRWAVRHP